MANWKKPGKAIAILSLILCLLVLVSCGMNPRKEPAEPAVPETTETVPQATEPHMIQAPQAETRPRIPELKAQLNSVTQTGASLTLYPEEAGNAEAYFRLYGVDGNLNYALPTLGGEYPASSYSSDGSPIDINVDWKDYWGVLSPGQYILGCHLRLYDKYTSETQIPFTIDRMAIPVPKEQEAARTCYRELFSQLTKNELHYRLRSPEGFTVELWELWDDFMLQTTYDPDYDSSQSPQEFYEDQNFVTCAGFSYIGVHQDPEDYTSPVIGWELYGLETPNPSGITRNEVLNNVFPTQNKPLEFTEGSYITPQEIHFFIGKDTQDPEKEYYEYTYFFDESGKLRKAEAYFHMPWTDGTEYYDEPFTLEFFPETGRQIQDQISSFRKDLKVQTFSWAQDKLIRETESRTVTTSGFTNTRGGHDIETPERAVNQALRELHFMEPIFGGILASYDPEAEMWRITFEHPSKTSQNIGLYERRDVYLDRNGRTVRIHFEDNLTMEDRITN